MKKALSLLCVLFISVSLFSQHSYDYGIVVYEGRLDTYVIYTKSGYCIVEVYSGYMEKDDFLLGRFNTYGFETLLNDNKKSSVRVYIEDWALSESAAYDWMERHNKLRY